MSDTTVKVFLSTDAGAPALSAVAGSMIAALDACLVNGYGSVTLDSLTVASNVATATKSTGHGFTALGTGEPVGPVIRVAGATPSGLNGDRRITVSSSTVFTFATTGISDQTATGTITAKRAPAGFSKAFSGTNKAAYRSDDVAGTQLYLRVDDTTTTYATVVGYRAMTGIDNGLTEPFNSNWYWKKADNTNGSRPWKIIADDQCFYLFPYWYSSYTSSAEGYWFGDIVSYRNAGDAYGCGIIAGTAYDQPYPGGNTHTTTTFYSLGTGLPGHALARNYSHSQVGIGFGKAALWGNGGVIGGVDSGYSYPDAMNNEFLAAEVQVLESGVLRGKMPGLYAPLHYLAPADGTVISGQGSLLAVCLGYGPGWDYARAALDITGPWR